MKNIRNWLRQNRRWLLIFDNVDDFSVVKGFLPEGPGHILITSRLNKWGQAARVFELDVFDRKESILFLSCRIEEDTSRLSRLAEALGDLPLALEQAVSFLKETECGIDKYLTIFQSAFAELLREGTVFDYNQTVATTWHISFTRVESESAAAGHLLKILAFLAPDAVPRSLFAAAELPPPLGDLKSDPLAMSKTLAVLSRYSLARVTVDAISVHRLVQTVLREVVLTPDDFASWTQQALDLVRCSFPATQADIEGNPASCARLTPHAIVVSNHASRADVDAMWNSFLLDRVATHLKCVGDGAGALHLQERALQIAEHAFGPIDYRVAARLNNLGGCLFHLDRFEEAHRVLRRALDVRTALFGPDHPELATTLANLGPIMYFLGHEQLSMEYMKRAIDLADTNDECFTRMVSNYASQLRDGGNLDDAQEMFERILAMDEARLGHDHLWVALDLEELAKIAEERHLWDKAHCYRKEALRIQENVLDFRHPSVLAYAADVAFFSAFIGQYAVSQEVIDKIVDVELDSEALLRLQREAPVPLWQFDSWMNTIGMTLRYLGRYTEALEVFLFCLARDLANHQGDLPLIALSTNNVGITLYDLGRLDEASDYLERSVQLAANPVARNPIFFANLALVSAALGNSLRARELSGLSLEYAEGNGVASQTVSVLEKVGKAFFIMGEITSARKYLEECVKQGDGILHPRGPVISSACETLKKCG